jgi:hypothetical protein
MKIFQRPSEKVKVFCWFGFGTLEFAFASEVCARC